MSPELKQAVQERIELGHSKEQIASELEAAGYDHDTIEHIYQSVIAGSHEASPAETNAPSTKASEPGGALISFSALVSSGFKVAASQWKVFTLAFVYQIAAIIVFSILFGLVIGVLSLVPGGAIVSVIAGVGLFVVYFAVTIALIGAMLRAVLLRSQGESFNSHVGWIRQRVWSAAGVALLQQLVVSNALYVLYVMVAVVATIVYAGGLSFEASSFESLLSSDGVIGLALLAIVGYLLMMVLVLTLTAYVGWSMLTFVSGRATGLASLSQSAALVSGRFMSVFWRLVFFGLLALAFMLVVTVLLTILQVSPAAIEDLGSIIQLLFVPFLVSAGVLLYESLYTTKQPMDQTQQQKIHSRIKVGVWTGAVAVVLYFAAIAAVMYFAIAFFTEMGGVTDDMDSLIAPTQFQTEQADINAQMQAELEAFQQEFQAEFENN